MKSTVPHGTALPAGCRSNPAEGETAMKLVITTNTGAEVATFENAEEMDYLDYSAELDEAIARAVTAEGRELPNWLQ